MRNLVRYLFLNAFLFVSTLLSQDTTTINFKVDNSSYWITAGVGNCYFGPTFKTNLSYSYKNNIFTLRYFVADEFRVASTEDDPPIKIKEIGALYGLSQRNKMIVFALGAGVAYIKGTLRGKQIGDNKFEGIDISALGIPIEGNFRIEFCKYIGVGGTLYGNINSKQIFGGWAIEFYLGKLR